MIRFTIHVFSIGFTLTAWILFMLFLGAVSQFVNPNHPVFDLTVLPFLALTMSLFTQISKPPLHNRKRKNDETDYQVFFTEKPVTMASTTRTISTGPGRQSPRQHTRNDSNAPDVRTLYTGSAITNEETQRHNRI